MSSSHPFRIVVDDQDQLATLKGFPGPTRFCVNIHADSWPTKKGTKQRVFAFRRKAERNAFRYMLNMLEIGFLEFEDRT